jgi:hypothetical protein
MQTAASPLSSSFANRLRAALWIAAAVLAIGLVVAVVVGLPSHHAAAKPVATRRALVGAYIARVDRIEVAMAPRVRAIDREYKLFARDPKGLAARAGRYRAAARTLALLARRLAAVDPPREARTLHSLLVRLADANVAVATTVASLASYLPAVARAQAPLRAAILTLRSGVKHAKTAKAQARAFADYAAATSAVAARVAQLRPPSIFRPARDAELAQLRRLAAIASAVQAALLHKDAKRAQRLVAELGQVETETTVAQAQRRAAQEFNAALHRISALATRVEKERRRLEHRLPS